MSFLLYQWRRLRLAFMMRGMSPEERQKIMNQVILEMKLDQLSRTLRRVSK